MLGFQICFIFISILGILDLLNNDKSFRFALFGVLVVVVVSVFGLSYKIGVDWPNYLDAWEPQANPESGFEAGYRYLTLLLSEAGLNYWFFYFFVKLLFLFELIYLVYTNSKKPTLCLGILIISLFPNYLEQVRQMLVATLLLVVFNHYKQALKSYHIIFATFLHSSALLIAIGAALSFINTNLKNRWYLVVFIALMCGVIYFFGGNYIWALFELDSRIERISYYLDRPLEPNMLLVGLRICFFVYLIRSKSVFEINSSLLGGQKAMLLKFYATTLLAIELIFFWIPLVPIRSKLYFLAFPVILFTNAMSVKMSLAKLTATMTVLTVINLSIWNFSNNSIAVNYSLRMNVVSEVATGFSLNDWEYNARNFWGAE
jgi:hypothetical protein